LDEALGKLGINLPFLLSQVVNFLILFVALRVFLWKPLMQQLDKRREMVRKQEEEAEAIAHAREEIEEERARVLEDAREQAKQVLAEAREQAQEITEQANVEAREKVERQVAEAREAAEEERDRLLGGMREQIAALSIAATQKLIGEALDERRQRALVESFFSGVREGRVEVLPEDMGRVEGPIVVTSAVPLTDEEKATVRKELEERVGGKVSFTVDPDILGGLVIRAGDRVIDGSMAGRLNQLREALV
jgi:F-type H+-transporting ATPase subunit b